MKKLNSFIFNLIQFGAMAILLAILFFSTFRTGPAVLKLPFYYGAAFLLLTIILVVLLCKLNVLSRFKPGVFIVLVALIAVVPRLIWIYFINTQPFSDFLHLYEYGLKVSQGDFKGFVNFYSAFPFKIPYGMVLGGIYYVLGSSLMAAKLINVLLSLILVFLVYAGAHVLYGTKAARVSALFAALWPADIMYTSVIASEHLFLVLFTAAVVLTLVFVKRYTHENYRLINGNLLLLGVGLFTALAQIIRPMAMLLLPVFIVFVLLYKKYRAKPIEGFMLNMKSIILVVACYFTVIFLINIPVQQLSGVNITRSDSGFNLMIGTNSKYGGMFNNEDFAIIEKNNYDIDKVHSEARKIAFDRITSNPAGLPSLFYNKFQNMWGNENYGYHWSTISAGTSTIENAIKSHPRAFSAISLAFYTLIIFMSICSCLYSIKERRYEALIILMIFGGIALSYLLLEVQTRYHMPVMPLLLIFCTGFLPGSKKFEV